MEVPSFLLLGSYKIYTFGIFLLFGFFLALFGVWQEGRRDGFDEEKLFDMFLLSSVGAVICSRVFFALANRFVFYALLLHILRFWTEGMSVFGILVGFLVPAIVLAKRWKWSIFRILDIFALGWLLGMSVVFLGLVALQKDFRYLFVFSFCALAYAGFSKFRVSKLKSGFVFSIFLVLVVLISWFVFGESISLIFYMSLVTMSLINLMFRGKLFMPSKHLPANLFKSLKDTLLSKLKRLEKEKSLLSEEDPYLNPGRDTANADELDDALLEDAQKEVIDLKKAFTGSMLSGVKRALGRMRIGKYGICEMCGNPIEKARLTAYPEASTCTSCFNKKNDTSI